uniref:Uncharacterized protein n=1 Tax=Ditylum brightwellii TaxID=49249 RepID=A0A6V2IYN4_9STRA
MSSHDKLHITMHVISWHIAHSSLFLFLSSSEFLELEFNNLSGSMPSDVCNLRTTNGGLLRFLLWRLTAKVRLYVLAARSVCEKILLWMLTAKVRLFTSTSSNMLCK